MFEGFLDEKLIKGKKIKALGNPIEGGEPLPYEVKTQIEANNKRPGVYTSGLFNMSHHSYAGGLFEIERERYHLGVTRRDAVGIDALRGIGQFVGVAFVDGVHQAVAELQLGDELEEG